ncbi:MAG: hypothetical protein H6723_12120 [Sandaracinus sp.]|nr:hypothetical protein [Sandaracinus sp.]
MIDREAGGAAGVGVTVGGAGEGDELTDRRGFDRFDLGASNTREPFGGADDE